MDTIHIALTFDDNRIEQSIVLMTSILANKGEENIHFHIIDGGISEKSKKILFDIKNCEVTFHFANNKLFEKCKKSKKYPLYHFYKIVLPVILNLDKLIFLSSETVVKTSLIDLWQTDLENNYIAAVEHAEGKSLLRRCGLKQRSRFFNMDVMLINCTKWMQDNIPARALDSLKKKFNNEQSVLNVLFHGNIKILDLRWNLQYCPIMIWPTYNIMDKYMQAIEKPSIINFSNDLKPWKRGLGYFNPKQEDYLKYQKLTCFAVSDYDKFRITDKFLSIRGLLLFIIRKPLFFMKKRFWKNLHWVFKNSYFLFHYQFE